MVPTPVLSAARRHLVSLIDRSKDHADLFAADCLAYEVAITCIERCIAYEEQERQRRKANAEMDAALERMFASRHGK